MYILPLIIIALCNYTSIAVDDVSEDPDSISHTTEDNVDDQGKLVMSSFLNKQGIRIRTYASRVENPKGHIILVHGARSHFRSSFCRYNLEWYEKYVGEYPNQDALDLFDIESKDIFPDLESLKKDGIANDDLLHGINAFDRAPRFLYEGSFVNVINKFGLSIYGLDLQSHGLSGGVCKQRCYFHKFDDFALDVMQFVSIVKRGKFNDLNETWDEQLVYSDQRHDNLPYHLIGSSMGGNIAMKSQVLFNLNAKGRGKFIDSMVCLSTMLNLDYLGTRCIKLLYPFLRLYSIVAPRRGLLFERRDVYANGIVYCMRFNSKATPRDRGEDEGVDGLESSTESEVELPVADLREAEGEVNGRAVCKRMRDDPLHHVSRIPSRTLVSAYDATIDLKRNMHHYPKYLPTLFIHSKDDPFCSIEGPREYMKKFFKDSDVVKLHELEGRSHIITMPTDFPIMEPILKRWFNSLEEM